MDAISVATCDRPPPSEVTAAICLAKPRAPLPAGVEHRLQIAGRTADDLEHVGGGGLLLGAIRTELIEQPRVLDRDDGLSGEVLDQFDLFVGERADLLTVMRWRRPPRYPSA